MAAVCQVEHDYLDVCPAEELVQAVNGCVTHTLEYEEFPCGAAVEVAWVTDARIREENARLRGKDAVTDVLSVPFLEQGEDGTLYIDDGDEFEGKVQLGQIILSYDRAQAQAAEYGHSLLREVCFLAVHSMLHLLGYDHERGAQEEADMFARQERILEELGIVR